jgi:hypothetical protein
MTVLVLTGWIAGVMAIILAGWSALTLTKAGEARSDAAEMYAAAMRARHDTLAAQKAKEKPPPAPDWFAAKRRRALWVHLTDDTTIKGLVVEANENGVLLEQAEYLGGEKSVGLGGRIWLPKDRINFTQVPPAANGVRP